MIKNWASLLSHDHGLGLASGLTSSQLQLWLGLGFAFHLGFVAQPCLEFELRVRFGLIPISAMVRDWASLLGHG